MPNTCSVKGCDRAVYARSWCQGHYARWRKNGDPGPAPIRNKVDKGQRGICSIEGCNRGVRAKSWCQVHYMRYWKFGDPQATVISSYLPRDGGCCVDGCDKPIYAKRLCSAHYQNARLRGDPATPGPGRGRWGKKWDGVICSVEGCERPVKLRGWCVMHYSRVLTHGDPGQAASLTAPRGSGSINQNGYREISVNGIRVLEHRHVMAQVLGRPLEGAENVHHRNGNRADNRPENLELWVTAQPPRQSVIDLVAFARDVIDKHGDEARREQLEE